MGDLLAEDFSIVAKDTLCRCLDYLLEYKVELFGFLHQRWAALFGAKFDVLLYDLTPLFGSGEVGAERVSNGVDKLFCYDPAVTANGPFQLKAGPESRQKNIN